MTRKKLTRTKTGKLITHGTANAYNNHGCRCRPCTAAGSAATLAYYHRTGRTRPIAVVNAERRAAVKHGSAYMYVDLRCRCDVCREGARVRRARQRVKQRSKPIPAHVHGTTNGAQNYACRCEKCRAASREAWRRRA